MGGVRKTFGHGPRQEAGGDRLDSAGTRARPGLRQLCQPGRSVESAHAVDLLLYLHSFALVGLKVAHDDSRLQRNPRPRVLCLGMPAFCNRLSVEADEKLARRVLELQRYNV